MKLWWSHKIKNTSVQIKITSPTNFFLSSYDIVMRIRWITIASSPQARLTQLRGADSYGGWDESERLITHLCPCHTFNVTILRVELALLRELQQSMRQICIRTLSFWTTPRLKFSDHRQINYKKLSQDRNLSSNSTCRAVAKSKKINLRPNNKETQVIKKKQTHKKRRKNKKMWKNINWLN